MAILKSYPLEKAEAEQTSEIVLPVIKILTPDIIITESFTI